MMAGSASVPRLHVAMRACLLLQATGAPPRAASCQTAPQALEPQQVEVLLGTPAFSAFLEAVRPR
jgi:hypothetical protein